MSGDMTTWAEITCQRGCATHTPRLVDVNLAARHGYADYAQVPKRLARMWSMLVWDPSVHPVDGGPYCPARDTVSETIIATGIWEPPETILVAEVCQSVERPRVLDLGCQIGWFSMLALASGAQVLAVDADTENLRLAQMSAGFQRHRGFHARQLRIGPDTPPMPPEQWRLVKIDLEGAETDAVAIIEPSIDAELVDHLLIEVTPAFKPGDHYPDLVCWLIDAGFEAYLLPPKNVPPIEYHAPEQYLDRIDPLSRKALRDVIANCTQTMVWFRRGGAEW